MSPASRKRPTGGPAAAALAADPKVLARAVLAGDRRALARAITLVESTRRDHRTRAETLLSRLLPHTGGSTRIGVSGSPGVGKSTFIDSFGTLLTGRGHRVAVLAVDPTSVRSGGAILGDKTRMTELARDPGAFIRPSPTGGASGGVARRTREVLLLAEAAGFDVVLVETVGIGQSEIAVADMVDFFLLLIAPGGGDGLQGIKRGVMELADLVVVNKADGEWRDAADRAAADYRGALGLMRPKTPHWAPKVVLASAREGEGVAEVWEAVAAHRRALRAAGRLEPLRAGQARSWMWREVQDSLIGEVRDHAGVAAALPALEAAVRAGEIAPSVAARRLLAVFRDSAGDRGCRPGEPANRLDADGEVP